MSKTAYTHSNHTISVDCFPFNRWDTHSSRREPLDHQRTSTYYYYGFLQRDAHCNYTYIFTVPSKRIEPKQGFFSTGWLFFRWFESIASLLDWSEELPTREWNKQPVLIRSADLFAHFLCVVVVVAFSLLFIQHKMDKTIPHTIQ